MYKNRIEQPLKNSCTNCKHFIQHYSVYKAMLSKVHCGHCRVRNIKPKEMRSFPFSDACELWECNAEAVEQNTRDLITVIENMNDRLELIYQFLKLD